MKMSDFEKERDEQLIEEREAYEKTFFENVVDDMLNSDAFDELIKQRFEYIDNNFDFEPSPGYLELEEIYYQKHESLFEGDPEDKFEEIDYPDESIFQKRIHEPDYEFIEEENFEDYPDYEIPQVYYDSEDYNQSKYCEELVQEFIDEKEYDEAHFQKLIDEHFEDEKSFLDSLLADVIQEQHYFEKAIDEHIFNHIEIDYYEEMAEYQEDYWYDDSFDDDYCNTWAPEDESVKDPFDSFDEIDYPEGMPDTFEYEPPVENYDEEVLRDYHKYLREKQPKEESPSFNDVDEKRNQELIEEKQKLESKFKQYFEKDDKLDKIIKEKVKEKKFNLK